jgi:hypothetical protein
MLSGQRVSNSIVNAWAPLSGLDNTNVGQHRGDVARQGQMSGLFFVGLGFEVGFIYPSQSACVVADDQKTIVVAPFAFNKHADELCHASQIFQEILRFLVSVIRVDLISPSSARG